MSVVNLLDTGAAYTLASMGGLDALTAGGRKVLITQDIYDEIMRSLDFGPKFQQWYNNNLGSIIQIDDPITEAIRKNTIQQINQSKKVTFL